MSPPEMAQEQRNTGHHRCTARQDRHRPVDPIPAGFTGVSAGGRLLAQQISGPNPITIGNSNLNVKT
jgi:hypothetical protein